VEIVKKLKFEAGHRLLGHESKCSNMHGHSYVVEIYATSATLDDVGRVIDFSVIKEKLGSWIDNFWDHAFLYNDKDKQVIEALACVNSRSYPLPFNPTAENLASFLLGKSRYLLPPSIIVTKVILHETATCSAIAR
jgi:6-pyruvoyltetrahydropterin/6-carboxytetrahydropterin synthase